MSDFHLPLEAQNQTHQTKPTWRSGPRQRSPGRVRCPCPPAHARKPLLYMGRVVAGGRACGQRNKQGTLRSPWQSWRPVAATFAPQACPSLPSVFGYRARPTRVPNAVHPRTQHLRTARRRRSSFRRQLAPSTRRTHPAPLSRPPTGTAAPCPASPPRPSHLESGSVSRTQLPSNAP